MDDRIISELSDPRLMSDRDWAAIKRSAVQRAQAERDALVRAMLRRVWSWIAQPFSVAASGVKVQPRDVAASRQRM